MQKVEGSSPFSRSQESPAIAGFFDGLTGIVAPESDNFGGGINHGVSHVRDSAVMGLVAGGGSVGSALSGRGAFHVGLDHRRGIGAP
jgi:hypothetical protein